MIDTSRQFEAALDEAAALLGPLQSRGTRAHEALLAKLRDIAAYRATVLNPASAFEPAQRARLEERLEAFEAQVVPHYGPHWHAMIGGDLRPDDINAI